MRSVIRRNPAGRAGRWAAAMLFAVGALASAGGAASAQEKAARGFSHEPHRAVPCVSCHQAGDTQLGPARLSEQQCQSCHHSGGEAGACVRCHAATQLSRAAATTQRLRLSLKSEPVARTLVFGHEQHGQLQCRTCHDRPPGLAASASSCGDCHAEHHHPEANCLSCHDSRPVAAHRNAVHLGCGGSDCHRSSPVHAGVRTRQVCLTCHAAQSKHHPDQNCSDCHVLPAPDAGGKGR